MSSFALKTEKRHAACDECRGRKLRCTGGLPECERCRAESTACVYSLQKPMGRPRKRKKELDDDKDSEFENHTIVSLSENYNSSTVPIGTNVTVQISQQLSHPALTHYDGTRLSAPQPTHYAMLHKQTMAFSNGDAVGDASQTNIMFSMNNLARDSTLSHYPPPGHTVTPPNKFDSSFDGPNSIMALPPPVHTPLNPRSVNHPSAQQNMPASAGSLSSSRPSPSSSSPSPSIWSPYHRAPESSRENLNSGANGNGALSAPNDQFINANSGNGHALNPVSLNSHLGGADQKPNDQLSPADPRTSPPGLMSNFAAQFPMAMMFNPMPPSAVNPNCACLSNAYLATSSFHSATISFPKSLVPIKKAIITASDILECEACPKTTGSAMQNMFTLVTLLMSLLEQVRKVLASIEDEVSQVQSMGGTKPLHMGDDPLDIQYSNFTGETTMSMSVDTPPEEWGRLAKLFVRNQIVGTSERPQTLTYIVDRLKVRQETWHATKKKTKTLLGEFAKCVADENGEYMCLKLVRMIKGMVLVLDC